MFATRTIDGSSGAATHTLTGRRARAIRRVTIACSSRSLPDCSSCSPRCSVDRRVGRAPGGAGERDRRGAQALAPHEQLGRGADEGGAAAPGAVHEAHAEARAEHAEHRGRVVRRRRVDGDLAGEDDLLEGAGADPLDGARDRGLVVLRRRGGGDPEAAGGRRVEQRERPVAQPRQPALDARHELLGHVVARREHGDRQPHVAPPARQRQLRHDQPARADSRPSAARPRRPGRTGSRRRRRARRPPGRPAGRRSPGRRAAATRRRPR